MYQSCYDYISDSYLFVIDYRLTIYIFIYILISLVFPLLFFNVKRFHNIIISLAFDYLLSTHIYICLPASYLIFRVIFTSELTFISSVFLLLSFYYHYLLNLSPPQRSLFCNRLSLSNFPLRYFRINFPDYKFLSLYLSLNCLNSWCLFSLISYRNTIIITI